MEKYRVENGKVFKYDSEQNAYFFFCATNGRSVKQAINDAEDSEYANEFQNY